MEVIGFKCWKCGHPLEAPADMAAKFMDCPECGRIVEVVRGSVATGDKQPDRKRIQRCAWSAVFFLPSFICIGMLFWALNPGNPYGYYTVLRVVVCAACVFLAVRTLAKGKIPWVWVLGVAAVIYNPVFHIHFSRGVWSVVNVATIIMFVLALLPSAGQESATKSYWRNPLVVGVIVSAVVGVIVVILTQFLGWNCFEDQTASTRRSRSSTHSRSLYPSHHKKSYL